MRYFEKVEIEKELPRTKSYFKMGRGAFQGFREGYMIERSALGCILVLSSSSKS